MGLDKQDSAKTAEPSAPSGHRGPSAGFKQGRGRFLARKEHPLWYKDAIIYEVHVRAFLDSNGDGIGDFRGLTQKLDYLEALGITAIWLLPFYPSPLKDDGYDIADYYSINPMYGTLDDFKIFLRDAHARNLRVITELVVNHTSDQHPWFQRSRRAPPTSPWRDFYVWSDTQEKYKEARIIFRDFEPSNWTWDPIGQAYYWHRFYSHQPDLNFDNPLVHQEIARVLDFWLDLGVDGLRLDAIPYLYEREGTSCENLPETHAYLKELRHHVDEKYGDRMLLAEANQWPEDAVSYLGSGKGDECHMAFHFPLMPRIFMSVRMEDRVPIMDILQQTPPIPETSQWALFLRNHDELTLEMVTDEERDFMYRVYARDAKARINLGIRRRLAPLLGNDRKRIELLNLLLFSLPGTPVLYYGDEIGMGDNVFLGDRNGVRTPMQWSSDKNAGFSRASPHALYLPIILDPEYHFEAVNVETQMRNPNSLFWWMKQALTLRKRYLAFGCGSLEFLQPDNRKILAFVRTYENERLLVIANLSRLAQSVQLDLSKFQESIPVELFGHAQFPPVTANPYFLTLSAHCAFWFSLEPASARGSAAELPLLPPFTLSEKWDEIFETEWRGALEEHLRRFLLQRVPAVANRAIKWTHLRDVLEFATDSVQAYLLVLMLEFVEGDPQEYLLPVALAAGAEAEEMEQRSVAQIIARLTLQSTEAKGILFEGVANHNFCRGLLRAVWQGHTFGGTEGELVASAPHALRADAESAGGLESSLSEAERNNTGIIFGDAYFLKLFRHLEPGLNPDLELGRFLTEHNFGNTPAVVGWLDYRRYNAEQFTLGVLTRFVTGTQDGWTYTLDALGRYLERIRSLSAVSRPEPLSEDCLLQLAESEVPPNVAALVGTYLELARVLGQRTGELHVALASDPAERDFAAEPFTPFSQRALYQSMRNLAVENLTLLRRSLARVPDSVRAPAEKVISSDAEILRRLRAITQTPFLGKRIRCHGDFHLGQILSTGKDFIFIDFEGEPSRPLSERRIKRSPLRDVASMLRSFDYISQMALYKQLQRGALNQEDLPKLAPWTSLWRCWVSAVYLGAYLKVVAKTGLLPPAKESLAVLLDSHLLEKALYELGYEIHHRPDWLRIPLGSILRLLKLDQTGP